MRSSVKHILQVILHAPLFLVALSYLAVVPFEMASSPHSVYLHLFLHSVPLITHFFLFKCVPRTWFSLVTGSLCFPSLTRPMSGNGGTWESNDPQVVHCMLPSLGGCAHMWAAIYYILEWMLVSSIPHVDGASIWLPYFDIAMCIGVMFVRLLHLSVFKRLKRYLLYLLLCTSLHMFTFS